MTLRVLVVEDDQAIRSLLQSTLAVEGFEVQTAVSLSEARALLRHAPPDVVLLDMAPDGGHLCDARHGIELIADEPVLQRAEITE